MQYEKLPTFSGHCGLVGHWHQECGSGEHDESKFDWGDFMLVNGGRGGGRGCGGRGTSSGSQYGRGRGRTNGRGRSTGGHGDPPSRPGRGRGEGPTVPSSDQNVSCRHNALPHLDVAARALGEPLMGITPGEVAGPTIQHNGYSEAFLLSRDDTFIY